MYDYSMFRTGIRGFEKEEVLEYIRKQENESSAAIAELEGEVRKKDEIIADLRKRLEIKDDQRAQLEEEIRSKYQKYIDNYEQIGALIYESRIRGNQMIEEAQQESDRLLNDARTQSETMLTKSKNDSDAMMASAKDKSMTMMNAAKTEAERLLYRARTESEEMRISARTESEELRRSAREESEQLLTSADAEAKRRVSSVQGQIDAKLTDGKKKYIAVQDEMNEIVDLFNQMQRRFMQSYKEIHEITQSMPDSLDDIDVDFDDDENLDGEYAGEEVRFHFSGRRDADDLLDEDEDAD